MENLKKTPTSSTSHTQRATLVRQAMKNVLMIDSIY